MAGAARENQRDFRGGGRAPLVQLVEESVDQAGGEGQFRGLAQQRADMQRTGRAQGIQQVPVTLLGRG